MKTNKIIFFIIIVVHTFFNLKTSASVINSDISSRYFEIFSKPILSVEDVNNYRKIIQFQEVCNWKQANKIILNLNNNCIIIIHKEFI